LKLPTLTVLLAAAAVPATSATADAVLARMDSAATSFRGMTAKIRMISYTAIIKETTEESGTITLRSPKPRTVVALIDFEKPDKKSFSFRDKKAQIYLPKINTVQEYDLGKYDSLLTQGLLIGFGTSSKDLQKNYTISGGTDETIEGLKTSKLELVPTAETIRQHITRIELWVGTDTGLPVQEKLYRKSGDYTHIVYSDMKLQSNLTDEQVKLKLPGNVKKEYPQK
jgi:outer membrane lipoprotein-sorting protein